MRLNMVSTETAVVLYAVLSSTLLVCQLDEVLTEALAAGASHPLNMAIYRASRGELSGDMAKATGTLVLSILVKDHVGTFVILNFVISMYALCAVLTKAMFLGPLSAIEAGKLSERMLKFLMLKLVFIAAVSGPDMPEIAMWVSWFAVVGWLKMFVGLARDRFDSLVSSPTATLAAHARTLALLLLLFVNDVAWIVAFLSSREAAPVSHIMLWLFDTVVAALEAAAILVKYGIYMADQLQEHQSWEGKTDFLYKVELATDMAVKSLTLSHLTHIWWLHGFCFHVLDAILFLDIRHLFCSICSGIRRYHKYRQATHNLRCFPDATACKLDGQKEKCAICRETMQAAKVLPCGHLFHAACLTAWLQQSGSDNFTCPLCRLPLFLDGSGSAAGEDLRDFRPGAPIDEPEQAEHDVEAETFSSQVVGQALAEAARSLTEGGNTFLRQNWAAEVSQLEAMVQNLRARLLQHGQEAPIPGPAPLPQGHRQLPRSQSFASSPLQSSSGSGSWQYVEELERQLDDIRDTLASSSQAASDTETKDTNPSTSPAMRALANMPRTVSQSPLAAPSSSQRFASQAESGPRGWPASSTEGAASRQLTARVSTGSIWPGLLPGGVMEGLQAWLQPDFSSSHRVSGDKVAAVQAVLPHVPEEVILVELSRTPDPNNVIERLLDSGMAGQRSC